ncbi:MAG: CDP-alcohol phosphatidyltransferase family protein [Acidobacteria bacterium]|nr:CDP-alcohol phosphatidyltransferase family protein [Acidobacteriota bacterium]
MFRHIPNILTVLRLLGTAPVVWMILERRFHLALVVSFLIAVTDSIDGWMARKWKLESRFGAIMDPLADKLLVGGGVVSLCLVGAMPFWLVAMALLRDGAILLAAVVLMRWKGVREFPPSRLGKANTFILMCTVAAVFLDFYPNVFFGMSACAIVLSGARYAYLGFRAAK